MPARRFRDNWMAVILHSVEAFIVLAMPLAAILG